LSNWSWGKGKTAEEALRNCQVNMPGYSTSGFLMVIEGSQDYETSRVNENGSVVHSKGTHVIDIGYVTLKFDGKIHIKTDEPPNRKNKHLLKKEHDDENIKNT
jgi:hypothetical protein